MNLRDVATDNPLTASVDKLRREFDRWVDYAVTQGGRAIDAAGLTTGPHIPAVDLVETLDEVHVTVDLPGVDPATIDLTLAGNMLTIQATVPARPDAEDADVHRRERATGEFKRSIPMPVAVNPDSVTAESHHGVLFVRLSKAEQLKKRSIKVQGGPASTGVSSPAPMNVPATNEPDAC